MEKTELGSDESIISLDVKSLYTNVPLKEAVEIALRRLYEQVNPPERSRKTMKKLPNLAVSKVHFKSNGLWYVQKDSLAMGASLAVILANLWLKEYELALKKEVPKLNVLSEGNKEVCPRCQKKVTYRTKGVECEVCLNWYHLVCCNISESEYSKIYYVLPVPIQLTVRVIKISSISMPTFSLFFSDKLNSFIFNCL